MAEDKRKAEEAAAAAKALEEKKKAEEAAAAAKALEEKKKAEEAAPADKPPASRTAEDTNRMNQLVALLNKVSVARLVFPLFALATHAYVCYMHSCLLLSYSLHLNLASFLPLSLQDA